MSAGARTWIGTSWKMHKTRAEARAYADRLRDLLTRRPAVGVQPFVLPPLTSLDVVVDVFRGWDGCLVGAQNGHWADEGAWTGEVSMPMLADAGARVVAVGHAERRAHFAETDETVAAKTAAAVRHGLTPIVCVGEPAPVRDAGRSVSFTVDQVAGALANCPDPTRVIIAYEPVWAIGSGGRRPRADEVRDVMDAIATRWPAAAAITALVYGGSVDQDNAAELLAIPGCDGLFASRAASTADGLAALIAIASAGAPRTPASPERR